MSTLIKKIERESIVLKDCEVGQFSWLLLFITIIITVTVAGAFVFFTYPSVDGTTPVQTQVHILYPLVVLAIGLGTFSLCGAAMKGFCTSIPGYSIRIVGDYYSTRYIAKTTPEQDQKAICRIVNELEPRARKLSKKERELEQIAQGCK